ncbi:DUF4440 domain-containing protein [Buttiauxella sp. A2-C1_F]|uniref:DUF4440 domain-containing protein n=1 Tax=Buttiauxella sp. A2-C1_F TaxID=2904526 RepID=UPI001E42A00A|nr:DUF4440 domain-containing protein [Buttiauxella sp. A2-C1_F]MCE0846519.1 DUF4440 domain-containing protein [Buttiauxella sp. A2-C1_F]
MNRYIQEVIEAHVAIENWLGKGEGDVQALLARFSPVFTMVTPGGKTLNFDTLSAFFQAQPAAKPGLKISLEEITVIAEWPAGAVVSYSEWQSLPGQEKTLRYSTVAFSKTDSALLWLRLHETAAV